MGVTTAASGRLRDSELMPEMVPGAMGAPGRGGQQVRVGFEERLPVSLIALLEDNDVLQGECLDGAHLD